MAYRPARPGSEGNTRLLKAYGGGSSPPRQHYATGGAVKGDNPALAEGLASAPLSDKPSKSAKKGDKSKKDAKINVNVIVAPKEDKPAMPPVGPAGLAPPPMPPGPPMPPPGGPTMPMRASGGRVKDDAKQDKAMVKAAVGKHEKGMHPGKPMTKLATGGPAKEPTTKGLVAEKGYQGGGAGGVGRLEKMRAYGKK